MKPNATFPLRMLRASRPSLAGTAFGYLWTISILSRPRERAATRLAKYRASSESALGDSKNRVLGCPRTGAPALFVVVSDAPQPAAAMATASEAMRADLGMARSCAPAPGGRVGAYPGLRQGVCTGSSPRPLARRECRCDDRAIDRRTLTVTALAAARRGARRACRGPGTRAPRSGPGRRWDGRARRAARGGARPRGGRAVRVPPPRAGACGGVPRGRGRACAPRAPRSIRRLAAVHVDARRRRARSRRGGARGAAASRRAARGSARPRGGRDGLRRARRRAGRAVRAALRSARVGLLRLPGQPAARPRGHRRCGLAQPVRAADRRGR